MKYLVWLEHSRTSININLSLPEAHSFLQSQSPGSRAGCRALPRLPLQAEKPTPSPSLVPSPHVTKTFCVPYWPSGNKLLAASAIRAGPFWHFDRQFLPLYIGVFFLFSIIPSCHMFLYFVRFFFLNESFVGFVDSSIFFSVSFLSIISSFSSTFFGVSLLYSSPLLNWTPNHLLSVFLFSCLHLRLYVTLKPLLELLYKPLHVLLDCGHHRRSLVVDTLLPKGELHFFTPFKSGLAR